MKSNAEYYEIIFTGWGKFCPGHIKQNGEC